MERAVRGSVAANVPGVLSSFININVEITFLYVFVLLWYCFGIFEICKKVKRKIMPVLLILSLVCPPAPHSETCFPTADLQFLFYDPFSSTSARSTHHVGTSVTYISFPIPFSLPPCPC